MCIGLEETEYFTYKNISTNPKIYDEFINKVKKGLTDAYEKITKEKCTIEIFGVEKGSNRVLF